MAEYQMPHKHTQEFRDLPEFTQGYVEAALFTAPDGHADDGFLDMDPATVSRMGADCDAFVRDNAEDIAALTGSDAHPDYDAAAAGRDFWYTRNGHGVGYWDRGFRDDLEAAAERLTAASEAFGAFDDDLFPETDQDRLGM